MMRWDIINKFIKANGYKRYLEIGYYKGWSFDRIEAEYKVAVDPNPCQDEYQQDFPYGKTIEQWKFKEFKEDPLDCKKLIHKKTSDEFFDINTEKFDIVFIDGLHEAEQVYKDIQNSEKVLNPGGVIILHDCNPPKYEHTTTGIDGCWTGDTYKGYLEFISDKGYSHITVDTDWGVGVIHPVFAPNTVVLTEPLTWEVFDKNRKELLNLISPEKFEESISNNS